MTTMVGILRAADDDALLALARYALAERDTASHPLIAGVLNQVLHALHDETHRRCEVAALETAWKLPGAPCEP
jgi:hypothetical protein